jgi:hypothetical protein
MHARSHCPLGSCVPQQLFVPRPHNGWQATSFATHPAEHPCLEVVIEQQCWPVAHPVEAIFKIVQIWLSPGLKAMRPLESQPLINLGVKKPGLVELSVTVTVGLPGKDTQPVAV